MAKRGRPGGGWEMAGRHFEMGRRVHQLKESEKIPTKEAVYRVGCEFKRGLSTVFAGYQMYTMFRNAARKMDHLGELVERHLPKSK